MTRNERRFLSQHACNWCEQRLDRDECLARYGERCSPEAMAERRRRCLETYKPRQAQKNRHEGG